MRITILGCGAAPGVPAISTGWGRCNPDNPKNRRRRASILVEEGGVTILVDASPDLRAQLLDAGVRRLDAVLITHAHADHTHGLDDLREVNRAMGGPIPVYGTPETLAAIEERFGYAFAGIPEGKPIFRPWLIPKVIEATQDLTIGPVAISAFVQDHGYSNTVGYRFGDAAYSTDLLTLPEASKARLKGLKLWIVGGLQDAPHPCHANVAQVLAWAAELKPRRTIVTHMSNDLDYDTLVEHMLPVGVTPGFDGMVAEV